MENLYHGLLILVKKYASFTTKPVLVFSNLIYNEDVDCDCFRSLNWKAGRHLWNHHEES